jgi:PAS domain-containing protein
MKTKQETKQDLEEELEALRRQVAQLQAECSQARQARQQAETALAESEQHLDLLTHQVPALVWTTDTNLTFTSALGAGLSPLDLEPCDMVGLSLYDYFQTQDRTFLPIAAHVRALDGEAVTYEMGWAGRVFHS